MKKRNIVFASLALLVTVILSSSVSAFWGEGKGQRTDENQGTRQVQREERKVEMDAHREEMDAIFTNGDFEAWKEMLTSRHIEQVAKLESSNLSADKKAEILEKMTERQTEMTANLTSENFAKMQKIHTLTNEVKDLREDLGFSFGGGKEFGNRGFGNKRGGMNHGGKRGGQGNNQLETAE
jgi:hypothetical protein